MKYFVIKSRVGDGYLCGIYQPSKGGFLHFNKDGQAKYMKDFNDKSNFHFSQPREAVQLLKRLFSNIKKIKNTDPSMKNYHQYYQEYEISV